MSSISTSFFCDRVDDALVAENFRLFWMNPKSHFFGTFLGFIQFFRSCSLEDASSGTSSANCEREGIVGGDEGPVGGVAQVVCHGVKVVGVHGEEGLEKDGEVRGEVKGEVEQLREKRSSWMV